MLRTVLIALLYPLFVSWTPDAAKGKLGCNRNMLKGLYTYADAPASFTYRMDDKVMDRLGEMALSLEYRIEWKDKSSCNHDLVVTKVTPGQGCPAMAANMYHVGDRISINVLNVTDKYLKYRNSFKGKSYDIIIYRIPEEELLKK